MENRKVPFTENPSGNAMALSRQAEIRLKELIKKIAKTPRLDVRHAAGVNLIMMLCIDCSLNGLTKIVEECEEMFQDGWPGEEHYEECFSEDGTISYMKPSYLDGTVGLEIDRMMYAISAISQLPVREWLLSSLVACARSGVEQYLWEAEVEWFLRAATGPAGWAQADFDIVEMPMNEAGENIVDSGTSHSSGSSGMMGPDATATTPPVDSIADMILRAANAGAVQ